MPKSYKKTFSGNPFKSEIYERLASKKMNIKKFARKAHMTVSDAQRMMDVKTIKPSDQLISALARILGDDEAYWQNLVDKSITKPNISISAMLSMAKNNTVKKEPEEKKVPEVTTPVQQKKPVLVHGTPKNVFYEEVRTMCKNKRIGIDNIAKEAGYSSSTVYNMLNFKKSYPSIDLVKAITRIADDPRKNDAYWGDLVKQVGGRLPDNGNAHNYKYEFRNEPHVSTQKPVEKVSPLPKVGSVAPLPKTEPVEPTHSSTPVSTRKRYVLLASGFVEEVRDGYFMVGIHPTKQNAKILLVRRDDGSYISKGEFTNISDSRFGLGIYDGKILVKIKGHNTLFAVAKYNNDGDILIDNIGGNSSIRYEQIEKIYDSSTMKEFVR